MSTERSRTTPTALWWCWVARVSILLTLAACAAPSTGLHVAPARGRLVFHGTGDVSLDPRQIPALRTQGAEWAWSGVGDLFRRDDLTIVNLECPATDVVAPVAKTYTFRCDPGSLPAARVAGVDVASQANNHAFDQGSGGLLDSLEAIRRAGITPVGAGVDQFHALRAAVFRLHGWSVAILGIDQVVDPAESVAGVDQPGTAAGHDFDLALAAIRRAARTADLVFVVVHWGIELDPRPTPLQVDQAHRMIDAGADAIFGSHPHRLQRLEDYRNRPIFYSLGNFVWPRISKATWTTAIGEVVVSPDGSIEARLLPAEIASDGHPVLR